MRRGTTTNSNTGTRQRQSQLKQVGRLALRDYLHEWVLSGCYVLALAAVLLPLLVLFGLKTGIISNLLSPLKEDPRYRQIVPGSSGRYDAAWFESMRKRPEVAFLVPRTRTIAATIRLRVPDSAIGRIIDVELIPSGSGDPALAPNVAEPAGYGDVVLSADAAEKLGVTTGEKMEGIISRVFQGQAETAILPLNVAGIANAAAFSRDGVFVSVELLTAVEDFRDGRAVTALGWDGSRPPDQAREYAGFRMYARGLDDVAVLHTALLGQGIDVRTRVADIEIVNKLDRNLSIVYWIVAIIAAGGFCVSFASSTWANVDRKRRDFSVLRLTGFRTHAIVWFPILQAGMTAVAGWLLAASVFFLVQAGLNALFQSSVGEGQVICRLLPWHFPVTLLLTLGAAVAAAATGGVRVAQLEPSLGLREG
jgi:putative ABC transport system permease protein